MSALARHLAQRVVTSGSRPAAVDAGLTSLLDLRPGASARISGYAADLPASTCRRLFDLGFVPGTVVDVVRRAPAQDPVIYRVAECEMAIRRVLAQAVLVERA